MSVRGAGVGGGEGGLPTLFRTKDLPQLVRQRHQEAAYGDVRGRGRGPGRGRGARPDVLARRHAGRREGGADELLAEAASERRRRDAADVLWSVAAAA